MMSIEIIAEIGINHNGSMGLAKNLIWFAKEFGADVAKFQLYDVDKVFPDKQIIAQGRNWYENVKKTQLTKSQVFLLAEFCQKVGIEFMASAYDLERLSWLEEIGVKRHKIATRMGDNAEFVTAVVETGKEVLVSVGEIETKPSGVFLFIPCPTVLLAREGVRFLYCVPDYPTRLQDFHLASVEFSQRQLGIQGLSDHSIGIDVAMVALSRGARIIEKHFTFDKNDKGGPDHLCSMAPSELKQLVEFARKVEVIL